MHASIHTCICIYVYTYIRICIHEYIYVCIQMNGQIDRLVYTYNPKVTYISKYNSKILNTPIYVPFMFRTHAQTHARTHTRTNLLVYT